MKRCIMDFNNIKKWKFIYSIILILTFLCGVYAGNNNYRILAVTDNIETANKIQNEIQEPTILFRDGLLNIIAIKNASKSDIYYNSINLARKSILTDDVTIYVFDIDRLKVDIARGKQMKNLNLNIENLISKLNGVYNIEANAIKLPSNVLQVEIKIETDKDVDKAEISYIIKELVRAGIPGLTKDNIFISYR